ncbi:MULTISPECIES: LLM class flavin-dependent oxidoreductase [unclassified Rhizobium]|uniref:LLM class flavin-dependent oxidoreductase n=1 Tax=unclassified Rhizobium TaxID=2613769 RepID=UPI0010520306|nr:MULTISPECIES: LLM class flavin-dependent oxidoreductase [unclassified Rhizobium]MBB3398503.1 FMN-dependent oxidoreductase (nitrilotriacetate monooxygenase family) [Rhizobium sp. BK060]TCM74981.1 FMN-dependent oxidoreductase (nitrilotriacetate monooxygenase family) [Rhizobium sp. BK068]
MSGRELHLNINILHSGFSPAAWRMEGSDPRASFDINHYIKVAKIAERGTFDAVFLADQAAISDRIDFRPLTSLEPTIVLALVAANTERIGLIGTASTTYNEPYNIARRFATLDHASGGRAGWNIVTSADLAQSRNFGLQKPVAHASRYERANEFAAVVKALWDSWEEEAFIGDTATGRFVDTGRVHPIAHSGKHFAVHGPHNIPRPPQGHPVLVQAGGSDDGRELAAEHAEAVFSASQSFEESLGYARDLRRRAARHGRPDDSILVLAGLATIIGSTEAEARSRQEELHDLIPLEYSLARLAGVLQVDQKRLELDAPLPHDIPLPADGGHTFFRATLALARREGLTVRGVIRALNGGTGHRTIVGTPGKIADDIETWFCAGAADGFNLMPDVLPHGLDVFVEEVVPLLRRRGLFRHEYTGRTLRDHLGLTRPQNPYVAAAE